MLGNGNPANMLGDGNPVNMLGVTGSRELGILSVIFNLFLGEVPAERLHLQINVCNLMRSPLCDIKTSQYRPTELTESVCYAEWYLSERM